MNKKTLNEKSDEQLDCHYRLIRQQLRLAIINLCVAVFFLVVVVFILVSFFMTQDLYLKGAALGFSAGVIFHAIMKGVEGFINRKKDAQGGEPSR